MKNNSVIIKAIKFALVWGFISAIIAALAPWEDDIFITDTAAASIEYLKLWLIIVALGMAVMSVVIFIKCLVNGIYGFFLVFLGIDRHLIKFRK